MSKKVRLGVVGCGRRANGVARLFQSHPDCEITALMDLYPACLETAKEQLKLPDVQTFTDYDALLRDGSVDALFMGCDPTEQVELVCRAMETGRHACTEVPAAFSIQECRDLIRAVEKTGCKYQLMEQTRYWGFVDSWRQMREAGELGHICFAQGEYIHYERAWGCFTDTETGEILSDFAPSPDRKVKKHWRYDVLGEPIYYLPHTLSPLLKILDDRVEKVSCMGTRKRSYTYEEDLEWTDIQYALMHTVNDTVLLAGAGFSMPYVLRGQTGAHFYELRGSKGSVESPRCKDGSFRRWHPGDETYTKTDLSTVPLAASEAEAKTGHGGADYMPVKTFIESILNDTTPPMDVHRTAEMTAPAILAAESARAGGKVLAVPDFRGE